MHDHYTVLGIAKDADAATIRAAFHALALRFHPDKCPGDKAAEERFKEITAAHEVLADAARRAQYDRLGHAYSLAPVAFVIAGKTVTLDPEPTFSGDLSDVYRALDEAGTEVAVKVGKNALDSDLLLAEVKTLRTIYPADAKDEKFYRYLPRVVASGKLADGRVITVLPWLGEYHSLAEVLSAHYMGIEAEDAVWIFKRILAGLGFVHRQGVVHGAVIPEHVLVHPVSHGAKLVDWSYSVKAGGKVCALASGRDGIYAPEILAKQAVSPATDILMAVRTVLRVLSPDAPTWFVTFLRGCLFVNPARRPQDAHGLHEEFDTLVKKKLGPPKYHQFNMPPRAQAGGVSHGRK